MSAWRPLIRQVLLSILGCECQILWYGDETVLDNASRPLSFCVIPNYIFIGLYVTWFRKMNKRLELRCHESDARTPAGGWVGYLAQRRSRRNCLPVTAVLNSWCTMHYLCGNVICHTCRSLWLSGLKSGSAAAWLLALRVRIPHGATMFVSCVCWVLCRQQPL